MQLAAAGYLELVRILGGLHAQCHVVLQLALEPFLDVPAGQELAFLAGKR